MTLPRLQRVLLSGLVALSAVACGRESGDAGVRPASAPEAETSASSGTIHIRLALHRTRVGLSQNGDYRQAHVFFRATLTNIGHEDIPGDMPLFETPEDSPHGMVLEVIDERGRAVESWPFIPSDGGARSPGPSEQAAPEDPGRRWLSPGESNGSRTSVHQLSHAQPVEGYSELPFRLRRPGKFRVRLVYDRASSSAWKAKEGLEPSVWELRVATPFLKFVVE